MRAASASRFVIAPELSKRFGLSTGTLARWRWQSTATGKPKGPQGWIYLSDTVVAYPEAEVEAWVAGRISNPPRRGRPPISERRKLALTSEKGYIEARRTR